VPCHRAGIVAQALARGRAVLGIGTGEAGPGQTVFVPGQIVPCPCQSSRLGPFGKL